MAMETPAKKRGGLFAFTGFWGGKSTNTAPSSDSEAKSSTSVRTGAVEPVSAPRVESTNASALESPAKRASDSQLASRKIIGRPQGPSSKLSQSFSASDVGRPAATVHKSVGFSSTISGVPKRMPGDNPYKASPLSASTISQTPAVNSHKTTNFSGAATTPRNMFRSSAMYQRPAIPSFSPRVPANTMKQSFPPNTPGKPPRGSTADMSARALAHTANTELFKMRIPSPPRHLTGEVLAKEVPDDPSRSGSIYADEFLAHYCPPDLDDHQRRQFFCILDLRRLKYAADEVFTKKDWKINILNFAKEYEKSRSLIMLRYGLYEFKTVRASEAVKKEWKQKHGIASSDDEGEPTSNFRATSGSKRKADDELVPTDTALTASSSNANKRARAPEAAAASKNKRKATEVGEPDENQPAKLIKPGATPQKAPSASRSLFESVANNTSTTPAKSPVKNSLFGATTSSKLSNGTPGRSVFESSSKLSAPATNIFGHLSDTSKGSPNNDADAESETSSNAEEEESEVQEVSPSEPSAAASVDAPTPQFGAAKTPNTVNGGSGASSDGGESNQGRSIFDRITRGSDGQPIRKLPQSEVKSPFAVPSDKERSVSPAKEQPASQPTNNTWNTGTPIKFAAPGSSIFSSTTPAATPAINFGASTVRKPESQDAPQPAAKSLFGNMAAPSEATPKAPAAPSLFSTFPPKVTTSTPAATSLFGSSTPAASQPKEKEESKEVVAKSATIPAAAPEAPKNAFQSSTLFGNQSKPETTSQPATGSLFGKSTTTETKPAQPAPTFAFGSSAAKPAFGAASATPSTSGNEPAAKKISFGSTDKSAPALFAFGSSTPAAAAQSKPLFGASTTPAVPPPSNSKSLFGATTTTPAPAETKSLFGTSATPAPAESKPIFGATTSAAPESKPLFGAASTTASSESKPIFGASTTPAAPATQSLFGATSQASKPLFGAATTGTTEAAKPVVTFGSGTTGVVSTPAPAPAPSSLFSFGSQAASQPAASQPGGSGSIFGTGGGSSFTFSAGGTDGAAIKNPFSGGSVSAPTSFNFGSGDTGSQPTTSFTFGSNTPAPTISFGGATDSQSTQQGNMFGGSSGPSASFAFGAGSSQPSGPSNMFSQKPATSIFGNTNLAPGGGTSTGTSQYPSYSSPRIHGL